MSCCNKHCQTMQDLEIDAERYRWLRSQHWSESVACVVTNPKQSVKLGALCPSQELLDNFIDTSMMIDKENG